MWLPFLNDFDVGDSFNVGVPFGLNLGSASDNKQLQVVGMG